MSDNPVDLDERRGMAAQIATEKRREHLYRFEQDQADLRSQQEELERLLAVPAQTWLEVAARAEYLIRQFADTLEAQDPRHKELVVHTLEDLARLCDRAKGVV